MCCRRWRLTGSSPCVGDETGGIASFAAIWLVIVPLEAALSASRRVVAIASTLRARGCGDPAAVLAEPTFCRRRHARPRACALAALGIISAALYADRAWRSAPSRWRARALAAHAEEDRYRLLARNMTDVITRHGRNGAVLFISPAAEALFGAPAASCSATACSTACMWPTVRPISRRSPMRGACGEARSVEFRVRRDDARIGARPRVAFIWVEMRCRPLDRRGAIEQCRRRPRSRRGDARHHRAQGAGAGARGGARARPNAPTPPRAASSPP